jgi:hypothetical protein
VDDGGPDAELVAHRPELKKVAGRADRPGLGRSEPP